MTGVVHPRAVMKALLQDSRPPRPLVLPLIFSWGARVENITRKAYLSDPTKIVSGVRQLWKHMPADSITCYFDPLLEAEALGAAVSWSSDGASAHLEPKPLAAHGLPDGLRSPDEAASAGRVPVAVEVLKRLKIQLREGPLRMVGLTGPLTLATDLRGAHAEPPPPAAVDACGAAITAIARTLLEAGAEVLLIHEPASAADAGTHEAALSQLETVVNIARFYEALPVLLAPESGDRPRFQFAAEIASRGLGCVACIEWQGQAPENAPSGKWGMALPMTTDGAEHATAPESRQALLDAVLHTRPAVITTAGEVPMTAQWKNLAEFCVGAVHLHWN